MSAVALLSDERATYLSAILFDLSTCVQTSERRYTAVSQCDFFRALYSLLSLCGLTDPCRMIFQGVAPFNLNLNKCLTSV